MNTPSYKPRFRLRGITSILLACLLGLILAFGFPILAKADEWFLQFVKSVLLILALILGLLEIRRLNSRLAHLSRVAGRLGEGRYSTRAVVHGQDSVALVGQALNKMAEQIETNINDLENSHKKLAKSQKILGEQNLELTEAYERRRHFGDFLAKLNSIDTRELLQDSFEDLLFAAKAQIGALFLFNEETQQLERLVESGIDRNTLRKLVSENSFEGLPGEAFTQRNWIIVEDLPGDILPELNLGFTSSHIRTVYGIPLLFHNKALGVVVLATLHKRSETTEQTIKNYIRALAQALNNALTHQAVQQQTLQFESANAQLSSLDRQRREFVAHMSHELRTPLNSIIGFSNILLKNRDQTISPANLERLEKINRNGKNLLELINDILDLSKVESGQMEIKFTPTELQPLLREVADMLHPLAAAKGIDISLNLPDSPVTIDTDRQKIRQILINLTNNAVKFTDVGNVSLRLIQPTSSKGPLIEVRDTGIGITEDKLDCVFEAFRQADNSTSRTYEGTGLGLTISQSIATLLGGKIRVKSSFGNGSTFSLELPKSPPGNKKTFENSTIPSVDIAVSAES